MIIVLAAVNHLTGYLVPDVVFIDFQLQPTPHPPRQLAYLRNNFRFPQFKETIIS